VLHNKFKQSIIKAGRKLPFSNNCLDELINRFGLERVTLYHQEMFLLPLPAAMVREELPLWERLYLPRFLEGKTVLDVGAGCGETAFFYIYHGAKRVVCIESDPLACKLIEVNRQRLNLNIEIICSKFNLEHLYIPHDFMKMDIEGGEVELLKFDGPIAPCVIEVHDQVQKGLSARLAAKFGLFCAYRFKYAKNVYILKSHE